MSSDERFLSIYQKNLKLLKWIAKKNRIPKDEVEDIVQETFLHIMVTTRSHGMIEKSVIIWQKFLRTSAGIITEAVTDVQLSIWTRLN